MKEYCAMSTKRRPTKQKEKMLAEARALFWKKGYQGATVRDIANAYGCKPANIYNFFPSKEEILFEVLLEEMEQVVSPIRMLEDDEETPPIEQLRQLIESHVKLTLSHRRTSKMLFDVALDSLPTPKRKEIIGFRDTYDRILRKIINRGIAQGCFVNIDPKLAGFMIAAMIVRTRLWFHPKKGLSSHELADFIFDFTLNGLTGNNALERGLRKSS
jgi:TetR/AcrR family transcriptional regulator, cholesterol catabolism regulator